MKGGYQRQKTSGLDIQDFARVFACFCVQSYDKRDFTFSRSQALTYLEYSKKMCNISFNSEFYLDDALKAVCLLVEDGLFITYTHRSFQEYFVAKFIMDSRPDIQIKLLAKYINNFGSDAVMSLLWEMNPILIEKAIILPHIDDLITATNNNGKISIRSYVKWLKHLWETFEIEPDGKFIGTQKKSAKIISTILSFVINNYSKNVGFEGYKKLNKFNFESKYKIKDDTFTYDISKAKTTDDLIKDLFTYGMYFSPITINLIKSIREYLIQKHNSQQISIEDLLLS